jgi:hypothetical protein
MSDSTWPSTIASAPDSKHEAQGTVLPPTPTSASASAPVPAVPGECAVQAPVPEQDTILPPKRNHNRRPGSRKPGPPRALLTTEEKQKITTMSAAGSSVYRISQTLGKGCTTIKRHLETEGVMEQVKDEQAELIELYKDRARECAIAITPEKIEKANVLQLATSSGILLDKSLLLSGKPTSIHVHALIDVLDMLHQKRDEEEEREHQLAKAALLAGNPKAVV